jgi:hypothetical protein
MAIRAAHPTQVTGLKNVQATRSRFDLRQSVEPP